MSKRFMLTAAGTASAAVAGIASAELIDFTVIQDQYIGEASYQIINSAVRLLLPCTSLAVPYSCLEPRGGFTGGSTSSGAIFYKPLSPLTLPLVTTRSLCKTLGVMAGIGTASKVASLSPETSMVPHRRTFVPQWFLRWRLVHRGPSTWCTRTLGTCWCCRTSSSRLITPIFLLEELLQVALKEIKLSDRPAHELAYLFVFDWQATREFYCRCLGSCSSVLQVIRNKISKRLKMLLIILPTPI